jgi:nucleotide-binding universal stress UspA family protein
MSDTANTQEPFVLLLGLNLGDQKSSGYAFEQAARISARLQSCTLHILHVAPAGASVEEQTRLLGLLQLYVSETAAALGMQPAGGLGFHVRQGEPAKEIAQLAAEAHADMIIVGTRNRPQNLIVGSTASRVMAATQCPVFVAGPRPQVEPSHVIVIDPPCPDCVTTRQVTAGKQWWCARHSERHHMHHRHVYSHAEDWSFAAHDSAVSPTGTD